MTATTIHPAFRQPSDPSGRVWRYMDFTKYISLLESSALYFCRLDQLGDRFEGSVTVATKKALEPAAGIISDEMRKMRQSALTSFRHVTRKGTYVNCWHMAEHESAAMWRLYSRTEEAISVQTSYSKLVDAFSEEILIGLVNYIDYDSEIIPLNNMLWPVMHKRLSFQHEREVRAVSPFDMAADAPLGKSVSVDLATLIENVYVSPESPDWFYRLVCNLTKTMGGNFAVDRSRLSEQPVF